MVMVRLLPRRRVAEVTGLSVRQLIRLETRGRFPAPRVISEGRVGYREDEVQDWIYKRPRAEDEPS